MRFAQLQRGQVLPILAVAAVALLGFAGLAADVGYHRYQQRVQQSATDSAALAGATELNQGRQTTSAKYDASKNGFTDDSTGGGACANTCITVNNPPSSGAYTSDSSAVEVRIAAVKPTFLERVFAITSVTIHTRAVARRISTNTGCLYALGPTSNTNFNSGTTVAANCTIYANGTINTNGASVSAQSIRLGNVGGSNLTGVSGGTPVLSMSAPIVDPCYQIDGCAYFQANAPSTSSCTSGGNVTAGTTAATATVINPGCYGNTTLRDPGGSKGAPGFVKMNPGTYVINGSFDVGDVTLSGTGVTFYITSGGSMNLNKAPNLNLTAPTSGTANGVLFFDPYNSPNFNKVTSAVLTGMLYFPNANCLNFNKSGASYAIVIAQCINWNGSSNSFNAPPANSSLIKDAILAE